MTQPTGSMRPLRFPLNRSADIESTTPSDAITIIDLDNWSTSDPDQRVDIVLNLSLNEYISLANSIDVGRDIAYGDNSILIWFLWVRSLESMAICQSIIDCIENDVNVRNAIQSANSGIPTVGGSSEKWTQLAIEPVLLCDKDTTWGYVKALWDFINQQNKDFLQQLAEATNTAEQIGGMISAIPLFGLLPFDEIADWLGRLGEYNLDAYNSSITIVINEQIWCDLFCIAVQNDCSITFEQVWDYMLEKFGGANFPTLGATFIELVSFMITGTYANDRIVYLWSLVQLGVAFIGGEWLGINSMNEFAIHAQTGDPDNDWSILCSACAWSYTSDFIIEDDSWLSFIASPPYDFVRSVWSVGNGWLEQDGLQAPTFYIRIDDIVFNMADTYVSNVTLTYNLTKGVYLNTAQTQVAIIVTRPDDTTASITLPYTSTVDGNGQTLALAVNDTIKSIRVLVRASTANTIGALTGSGQVTQVSASGDGTNPFPH